MQEILAIFKIQKTKQKINKDTDHRGLSTMKITEREARSCRWFMKVSSDFIGERARKVLGLGFSPQFLLLWLYHCWIPIGPETTQLFTQSHLENEPNGLMHLSPVGIDWLCMLWSTHTPFFFFVWAKWLQVELRMGLALSVGIPYCLSSSWLEFGTEIKT